MTPKGVFDTILGPMGGGLLQARLTKRICSFFIFFSLFACFQVLCGPGRQKNTTNKQTNNFQQTPSRKIQVHFGILLHRPSHFQYVFGVIFALPLSLFKGMFKFHFYCFASLIGVSLIIGKEAYINQQFYTTVVSLTTSKVGRVALYNAAIVLLFMFGQFLRWFFLGELKPREVEVFLCNNQQIFICCFTQKAFEQTFYYVATTCLALTIFREHMNATILALFVLCLFIKVFHWLAQSRQEYVCVATFPLYSKCVPSD